jgi:quinol monooxygenase YgiN
VSVIVTLKMQGDPKRLEQLAAEDPERVSSIAERAKSHGVIAHRFYASDGGKIMVIDEWPDAESFQTFFGEASDQIQPLMQDAGVTSEPEITIWEKLETGDDVGWGA